MKRAVPIAFLLLALCGCEAPRTPSGFNTLAGEFAYTALAFSPVNATAAGYHTHQGQDLDKLLDDFSPAALDRQRQFYQGFEERLKQLDPSQYGAEDRADYTIVRQQIALALLELDRIQSYRHNPAMYVELVGNALFTPYMLAYAPVEERIGDIIARLEKLPQLLDQARSNLVDSPPVWTNVALEENAGNIVLIDKTIRAAVPETMRTDYNRAAAPALDALRKFSAWLKTGLKPAPEDAWRLGRELYDSKFRYALGTDRTPAQVLESAEADLNTVRARMLEIAQPLHKQWFPRHREHRDADTTIREVLDRIARKHSTPATYMADAKNDLAEAREFVRAKNLLALPVRGNLEVIPTPDFLRGIYAVGGFMPAPPLEPQLGAFYWITPIPSNWPKPRQESKLREYNFYKLKLLTLHEAVPGHYVQFEYANDVQPEPRRVLRSVYGNGPYIEGWAQYATQMMLDAGYLDNSPELRLTFLKEELRVLANAILDVRLQTMGMTDRQALDLMTRQTFQETEEATAKLQRAKLSSAQLPTYYVGWRDWLRVREQDRKTLGAKFRLAAFNQRALNEGAVPLPVLERLLAEKVAGE
jgi:uncharacterized protein (DUF885 family)